MKATFWLLFILIRFSNAKILPCGQSVNSTVCYNSEAIEGYVPTSTPEKMTFINITLTINNIIEVDESKQTVTMLFKIILEWFEPRVDVKRSQEEMENNVIWYLMDMADMKNLWSPAVYLGNAENVKKSKSLGDNTLAFLWYKTDTHMLHFSEIFSAKVSCELDFRKFPMDSHYCILELKNWIGAIFGENTGVRLNPPKIFTTEDRQEIGGQKFNKSPARMKFHFTFESLKSSTFQQANYTYSMAQIRMNLTRTDKSRQKIFAGYHVTTGIFSALSLV